MLHELLLALYGIPGGVFVESTKKCEESEFPLDSCLVPISNTLPFVPQGELALYSELLKIGSCYKFLEQFIRRYGGPYQGLYVSAIAFGIDDSLKEYRELICSLESEILADCDLGVAHISYRLHSYKILLPVLARVAKKIESSVIISQPEQLKSSCKLLDIILAATPPGLPGPRIIIQKILVHVMQVFYRQLSSWLLYGVLHDPHKEFFIHAKPDEEDTKNLGNTSHQSSYSLENLSLSGLNKSKKVSFFVDDTQVPSFLPSTFAQRVLITGESVYSACCDPSKSSFLSELEEKYACCFSKLSRTLNAHIDKLETGDQSFNNFIDVNSLSNLVCEIQQFVSRRAWVGLLEEHNLMQNLRLVKDVLLLGRGELFLAFLDQLNLLNNIVGSNTLHVTNNPEDKSCPNVMDQRPPNDETELRALEYDIMEAFLIAARSIGLDDEELEARFRFSISLPNEEPNKTSSNKDLTVWDCLNLYFIVPPQLECVFSAQVCRAYSRLFRFLFAIRRTQLKLQQYWADQILLWRRAYNPNKLDKSKSRSDLAEYQLIIDRRLLIRSYMAFIIENLQYYLQVDVIESQFSHLVCRIQTDQEVELVQIAHEAYLAALQAQTLLFYPNAKSCINNLLNICHKFVNITTRITKFNHDNYSNIENQILIDFQQSSLSLFKLLNLSCLTGANSSISLSSGILNRSVNGLPGTTDLGQLLLRLDYNYFYSDSHGILKT